MAPVFRQSSRLRSALTGLLLVALAARPACTQPPAVAPLPPELVEEVNDPTTQIAFVGDLPILAGDLLPAVDQALQEYEGKVPTDQFRHQRALFVQQMLPRKIEVKLVMLDFLRSIPADKQKEVLANVDKQVDRQYYEEQLPETMKHLEVDSLAALQAKLNRFGTNIDAQKAEYREQMLVRTMISQKVNRDPEITHDQLLTYYHEHLQDFDLAGRARWEQLTARFDRWPTRAAADEAIVEMGNQVLRGADFAAVARKYSQGVTAADGGYHDWTTQGSLVSDVLDQAIFSLPLGRLSLKLEDQTGYHIIRVLEREPARRVSFVEAQESIRDKLSEADRKRQVQQYLERLRQLTYVWTIFDQVAPPAGDSR